MRFSFRLAEILNYSPDPKKRPGVIKSICEYTGLDRHQVASLLKNESKNIPLEAISRLCDYLIEYKFAAADQLPGALFSVEAENFWELLARRGRLEMCLGVRRTVDGSETPEGAWVVASDSVLLGELLNGVSTLGGTAKLQGPGEPAGEKRATVAPPHPEHITQSLVWSPLASSLEEVRERAAVVYSEFCDSQGDKALVCLGSTKSNPVGELIVASAFGCDPYVTQEAATPDQRACPFYLRFRDSDPHPTSCFGGDRLSGAKATAEPGIYFELPDGSWKSCGCGKPDKDAALVFYIHREAQGWLEMVLAGFSGRATRLLSRTLATRAQEFWPPVYSGAGVEIGAFVVEFTITSPGNKTPDLLRTDLVADAVIHRLSPEVFRRRLELAVKDKGAVPN